MALKPVSARELLTALESGRYTPLKGRLRFPQPTPGPRSTTMCCLGVACDLAGFWDLPHSAQIETYVMDSECTMPSLAIQKEAFPWMLDFWEGTRGIRIGPQLAKANDRDFESARFAFIAPYAGPIKVLNEFIARHP